MSDSLPTQDGETPPLHDDESSPVRVFRADGTRFPNPADVTVEPFDFRTPVFLAEGELRRLRAVHQHYAANLSARLSSFLRGDVSLTLSKLTTLPYAEFVESIPTPSHLTLFKVDPLPGVAILEMTPKLALSITNRMLGGRGLSGGPSRPLTEIEASLLEEIEEIITSEWCLQWPGGSGFVSRQIAHETDARFLQVCPDDTIMLVLGMEAEADDTTEQILIAVPCYMLEPSIKKMQVARTREVASEGEAKSPAWRSSYERIAVPVVADWQVQNVPVRDLLCLRVGDIVELPRAALENIRVRLSNSPRFRARAGCENGHVAVQIHEATGSEFSS